MSFVRRLQSRCLARRQSPSGLTKVSAWEGVVGTAALTARPSNGMEVEADRSSSAEEKSCGSLSLTR